MFDDATIDNLAQARLILGGAIKSGRPLTPEQQLIVDNAKSMGEDVARRLEREQRGSELLKAIGGGPAPDLVRSPNGGYYEDYSGANSGQVEYLDFGSKAFGRKIAESIKPAGSKALITTGSQIVDTPLIVANPMTLARPLQSFLEALPVVRRAAVYSILRQVTRTPNAGVVAPGATKPVSAMTLQSFEKRLKIVATLSEPVNRYDLEDFTNLGLFVQSELQYAIQLEIEDQVLNGTGTGENFEGLANTSGIQLYTAPAGQVDDLVSIRKALSIFDNSGETANVVILNPTDWEGIVTKRNSSGAFDLGTAVNEETRRVWGKPVALSGLVPSNTAWVLGEGSANISTDGRTHLDWDASTGFATNTLQARVETRAEVDVVRPSAIVKATFVDA